MMATKAMHMLGDISRDEPDLCIVNEDKETETDYVGNWVFGLGLIDVKFPKDTTRELTEEEYAKYDGEGVAINNTYLGKLRIREENNAE